ncbi:hypothetical protein PC110_g16139 [Phytophthora cactorum]|uniref:Uncharacterized protein n=1 Tax=Phytophthora cactorum TaxID=29920 RepID=A0A329RT71_9STRA|nr:hypothetical protein PC110_g16139 [Phytophthora cactorum]
MLVETVEPEAALSAAYQEPSIIRIYGQLSTGFKGMKFGKEEGDGPVSVWMVW